jgi:hypothetical protein
MTGRPQTKKRDRLLDILCNHCGGRLGGDAITTDVVSPATRNRPE